MSKDNISWIVLPTALTEDGKRLLMEATDSRVCKMSFGKNDGKPDKTVIIYDADLILRDIRLGAYGYVVNGKSVQDYQIMKPNQLTLLISVKVSHLHVE